MAYRNYGPANGAIINQRGNGDFPDLVTAMASAGSANNLVYYVNEGTYTNQNFTLPDLVTLTTLPGCENNASVATQGKITFTAAGTATISNMSLVTNGDFCIVVSGSNACNLILENCFINCVNHTGISFTNTNASSGITFINCRGDIGVNGATLFSSTSPGGLGFLRCNFSNTALSTAVSTTTAGGIYINYSNFALPLSCTGTSSIGRFAWSFFNTFLLNVQCLFVNGSGSNIIDYCGFTSGFASCINVNSTCVLDNCIFESQISPAIDGAGTIEFGVMSFDGTSTLQGVLTKVPFITRVGSLTVTSNGALTLESATTMNVNNGATIDVQSGAILQVDAGAVTRLPLTGIIIGHGAGNAVTASSITQYNVITGGATQTLNYIAPSATSGVPLISQGASAQPVFGTVVVAGGGTGLATLTAHSIQVGNGTGTVTQLGVGATGTVLTGVTGADPAFSATPTVTSINFGGSSLSSYVTETSWTPGISFGGSSTGITYSTQTGLYERIGNVVFYYFSITLSSKGAQTGTAAITGLPITTSATYLNPGTVYTNNITLTGTAILVINTSATTISIYAMSNGTATGPLTNTAFSNTTQLIGSGFYYV